MSIWKRLANVVRGDREVDDELQSHLDEAISAGRDAEEARRAFGSALRYREESRDVRVVAWLDSLRADAVFGWRQLCKRKVTSAAAILSLALGIGACTSAFRLMDALLWRPLPVAGADRLYSVAFTSPGADAIVREYDSCSYPMFRQMRAAVADQAESVAVSYADRMDLTYGSDREMEKAYRQFVSGWMFRVFGLRPAAGRLLTDDDDRTPGAHPVAVISHDYWMRRFGGDPRAVGRTFRMGDGVFQIVGVVAGGFTGTETGTVTDVFLPMMMKTPRTLASSTNFWLRTLVQLKPGVAPPPVYERLRVTFRAIQDERAKGFMNMTPKRLEKFLQERLLFAPAAAGRSNLQRDYRQSLASLGILVALVLLIACANVANLMTAQAASRAREMALRISIGAGRWRLVQLVLVESAWVALLAACVGALFAWRAAPLIVGMIQPANDPARLVLPADWRVLGFGLSLALLVTMLFGAAPALRASAVKPASALKGGDDPHARGRAMRALIAVQVAFCFVVLFVAGLFVTTFDRLSKQPTGFSAARIVNLETLSDRPQPAAYWEQVREHLRGVPGVETVAMGEWPVMSGESNVGNISIHGAPPSEVFSDFFKISPGWVDALKVQFLDGRDFRAGENYPAVAIVNESFAKQLFDGANPVGESFERVEGSVRLRFQVVGWVRDARSRDDMRLAIRPLAYVPFPAVGIGRGTFVVRTAMANPLALAGVLRQEVPRARPGFRVTNIRTQEELVRGHMVRERLLALLAMFFAGVALLLAGIGLYGVLDYSVLQRRREIGIRMAIGAQAGDIARRVTVDVFWMVAVGAVAGVAAGLGSVRYIEGLLFEVRGTDWRMLVGPAVALLLAAMVAAAPAVVRAVRIDPVQTLRT